MGTRSLIRIIRDDVEIVCIYQQFDGYPSGVGAGLAEFLQSGPLVNGISSDGRCFNGMGCLAAQYIAENKKEPGGLYIYAPGSTDCGEEYVYEIRGGFDCKPLNVKVLSCYNSEGIKTLYTGDVKGFAEFCDKPEQEE